MSVAQWGDRRVLVLMAAEPEYGPELRARIAPVMTGIGPVEGAVVATATLAELHAGAGLPDLVVTLGSAGSARLAQAQVYQASHLAYRDMDASALGFPRGVTPFLDLPAVIELPLHLPGVPEARLSTGGNVVSGPGYDGIAEEMVDMESYAIWRACARYDAPLVVLRGISDGAAPLEGLSSWTEYLDVIDARLAEVLDRLRAAVEADALVRRAG